VWATKYCHTRFMYLVYAVCETEFNGIFQKWWCVLFLNSISIGVSLTYITLISELHCESKTRHQTFVHNFAIYWPMFKHLLLVHSARNFCNKIPPPHLNRVARLHCEKYYYLKIIVPCPLGHCLPKIWTRQRPDLWQTAKCCDWGKSP